MGLGKSWWKGHVGLENGQPTPCREVRGDTAARGKGGHAVTSGSSEQGKEDFIGAL